MSSSLKKDCKCILLLFAVSNTDRSNDNAISTCDTYSMNIYWAVTMNRHFPRRLGNGDEQYKTPCSGKAYIHLTPFTTSWKGCY